MNMWARPVGGLEKALSALQEGNVDVGFLHETKLTQDIQTWHGTGYNIWAMEAKSWHRRGVALVWRLAK